jgi:hypothetical protein
MRRIHHDDEAREGFMFDLDEIARAGARRMLMEALEKPRLRNTSSLPEASETREGVPWL